MKSAGTSVKGNGHRNRHSAPSSLPPSSSTSSSGIPRYQPSSAIVSPEWNSPTSRSNRNQRVYYDSEAQTTIDNFIEQSRGVSTNPNNNKNGRGVHSRDSKSDYRTIGSLSSHAAGTSVSTPIASNCNPASSFTTPKPTRKTSNLLAANNNRRALIQSDKGEEGIQTKSCLTFRLPATSSSNARGESRHPLRASGAGVTSTGVLNKKSETHDSNKMTNHKPNAGRFGWVRRGRGNDNTAAGSRAATSQASSSVYPEEDYFDVAGDDIEFPPNASWAEGSLSPTSNLESKNNKIKVTNDKPRSTPNKVQITSPMTGQEVKDLFSPPPIKDRGSDRKKIKQYEQEKRRRGLYEGEIEPDGIRGQEARVVVHKLKHGATTGSSIPQLSISPTLSTAGQSTNGQILQQPSVRLRVVSSVSTAEGLPASSSLATPSSPNSDDYDPQLDFGTSTSSSSVDDENARKKTALHTNIVTPPQISSARSQNLYHGGSTLSAAHSVPIKHTSQKSSRGKATSFENNLKFHKQQQSDISESTCSDDNIQQMLPDLVPVSSNYEQGRNSKSDKNNQFSVGQDRTMLNRFVSSDSEDDPSEFPTDERSYDDSMYDGIREVHSKPVSIKQQTNQLDLVRTGSISSNTTSSLNNTKRNGKSIQSGIARTGNSGTKSGIPSPSAKSPSHTMKSFDLTSPPAASGSSVKRQSSDDKQSSTGTSTTGEISSTDSPANLEVDKLNSLAVEHVNAGQFDEALRLFTRVLQIHHEMHGHNTPHPNTASAYHNLGTVHAKRAQAFEQAATTGASSDEQREQQRQARSAALQCFQAAARSARDSLGKNHPNVAVSLVRIGFLLLQSKQYSNADTTFSEALRIRLEHYGSEHSLVANLYNNLGVCRMHLGAFENGLAALEEALKIQHSIIVKARNNIIFEAGGKLSAQEADQDEAMVVHKLELADTLFNIGGLCLEWIRRDGENFNDAKPKRSSHAYRAFEEAYNIRLAAYKNNENHPAVVQVQSLLRTAQQYMIVQNQQQQRNNSSTYQDSNSSQPHEISAVTSSFSRNASATNSVFDTPARSMVSSGTQTETKIVSEPIVETPTNASSLNTASRSNSKNKSTRRTSDKSNRRHIDTRIQGYDETSSNEDSSIEGDRSSRVANDHASERKDSYERLSDRKLVKINEEMNTSYDTSIFRDADRANRDFVNRDELAISASYPPLVEVITHSTDDDDNFRNGGSQNSSGKNEKSSTRIFVAPHSVPKTSSSPSKLKRTSPGGGRNSSDDPAFNSISLEYDNFSPDISKEGSHETTDDDSFIMQQPLLTGQGLKSWSYDVEENCMIRNTGVDSDRGRIHYPILSNKPSFGSGSIGENDFGDSNQRDIMIAQPFQAASNKGIQPIRASVDKKQYKKPLNFEHSSPIKRSSSASVDSKGWGGSEVSFSTGNKERDEIMNRARTILDLANIPSTDSEDESDVDTNPTNGHFETFASHNLNREGNSSMRAPIDSTSALEQDYLEDGVAPLGDSGRTTVKRSYRQKDIKELLKDPMTCLPEIHEEASRQLKNNNPIDAIHLFETILRCQRRRFGALHPDVAAALHNVGIAQLRVQNHVEALKAFEEAARVRKGSLGKDHPLVAVSLVKVGITLLLLKRFEEALWSFREALSVRKNSLGPLHPSTARIYNNIGCVYVEFNEFRQARRAFEAALDTQRSALIHEPNSGPLMFGTATTLCNLGYLYRFRGMHDKAATVLKEAVDLQEAVLGKYHSTVLSTLDNLADSCCNSGNGNEALRCYNSVLERFQKSGNPSDSNSSGNNLKVLRAESVLHYKMSRVHRIRNDRENQLESLQLALKAIRSFNEINQGADKFNSTAQSDQPRKMEVESINGNKPNDSLERRVLADIRTCREILEKEQLKWI